MKGKLQQKVTKHMTLTYLASFKKFLDKSLAEKPDVTVPELIESIETTLNVEGYMPPAEEEVFYV